MDKKTDKTLNNTIDINPIPYLTWTWLKINKDSVSYDFSFAANDGIENTQAQNIKIQNGNPSDFPYMNDNSSIGKQARELILQANPDGKTYIIEKGNIEDISKPLFIRITADKNSASYQKIFIKAGAQASVIIVFEGGSDTEPTLLGNLTEIYAEEDSKLHISKIQLCGKAVNQLDDTAVICKDRAKVSLTQIELGGAHIDAGFHAALDGYQSSFYSDTAYICQRNQYLDMNQVVVHKGKKTVCDMKTHGTAKDQAVKTYRGTIDMRKGCAGSQGNEIETTLLLSPKAVVKAAPIILCGEEDIAAEHGSTIGKLSNEMLFYMNSRGIDQKTAEALLTRAKITAAASSIEDEGIQKEINRFLDE